jgi:hypothetical protein
MCVRAATSFRSSVFRSDNARWYFLKRPITLTHGSRLPERTTSYICKLPLLSPTGQPLVKPPKIGGRANSRSNGHHCRRSRSSTTLHLLY